MLHTILLLSIPQIALIVVSSLVFVIVLSIFLYKPFFKRFYDVVFSFIGLIILLPLFLLLTLTGLIIMKGNPFFIQIRPGKKDKNGNEKLFKLIKFRSMSNKKDSNGNLLPDKDRIGWYGRFIRATSFDELPELLNVLIGNMSLIGPRPQLVIDLVFMSDEQRHRHDIRPGITGLAQINGRNNIAWEKKFEYDLKYLKQCSLLLDIKILFFTVFKVFIRSDINRVGTESDLNFGEYLLLNQCIDENEYNKKLLEAKKIKL